MIRVLAVAALLLLAAGCGGDPAVQTRTPPGDIEATYAVHGDRLYLHCIGRGSPVVVLEAGGGGDRRGWDAVQPELARTTRVCSYDRAGLAFSDAASKRATATQKANDLHDLLLAADVDGPYVLVGHSYGGMLVRVYAARYPDDVDQPCARDRRLQPAPGDDQSRAAGSCHPRDPRCRECGTFGCAASSLQRPLRRACREMRCQHAISGPALLRTPVTVLAPAESVPAQAPETMPSTPAPGQRW